MGVGYQVSALHEVGEWEIPAGSGEVATPEQDPISNILMANGYKRGAVYKGHLHAVMPPIDNILVWRNRIASKYRSQLGEDLSWNEDSSFVRSEDIGSNENVLYRYIAAVIDQQGESGVRALIGTKKPSYATLIAIFAESTRRSFGGRFPQLLLGAQYWLPFKRHMIIEEPDWAGRSARFGSSFRLADELQEIHAVIISVTKHISMGDDVLGIALPAGDIIMNLCNISVEQRLPFWTTG